MQPRTIHDWPKILWRILTHPTSMALAALALVALAAWVVVLNQMELQHDRNGTPLLFGQK